MNAKFLITAALLGGLTMFFWGFVSHMLIPWWNVTMSEFSNDQAVIDAIKAGHADNGIYFSKQGVFAAVRFQPGVSDSTADISGYMIREFVNNMLIALVTAYLLFMAKPATILRRGFYAAVIGFAGWTMSSVGLWNWYGFSSAYTIVDLCDGVIGMFLVGLVIAWLMQKMKVVTA